MSICLKRGFQPVVHVRRKMECERSGHVEAAEGVGMSEHALVWENAIEANVVEDVEDVHPENDGVGTEHSHESMIAD